MSPRIRTWIYVGLYVLNAGLLALQHESLVPAAWTGLLQLVTLLVASFLDRIQAAALLMILAASHTVACDKQTAHTAVDIGLQVSADVCKELTADGATDDWVDLACAVESAAGGVVHVLMPRRAWRAVQRSSMDAAGL